MKDAIAICTLVIDCHSVAIVNVAYHIRHQVGLKVGKCLWPLFLVSINTLFETKSPDIRPSQPVVLLTMN